MFKKPCAECHKLISYEGQKEDVILPEGQKNVIYLCQECGDELLNTLFFEEKEPVLN
jgi:RNase P subunit RPR2